MRVVALDLSLTESGVAVGEVRPDDTIRTSMSVVRSRFKGPARLSDIRHQLLPTMTDPAPDLVLIEGYAFAAGGGKKSNTPSHAHALGELGGVIRLTLFERGITFVEVAPTTLKKYATGKGNAGKADVLVEAVKRLGYPGSNSNEADSFWLMAMGMEHLGRPLVPLPQTHQTALMGVSWPEGL